MQQKEIIKELVNGLLPSSDYFLVEVIIKGMAMQQKVMVIIDSDNGVSIDGCASVSRGLALALEEKELFPGKYTLDVSSPGVDHPLSIRRQFNSRIGKSLKLYLNDETEIVGELLNTSKNEISIKQYIKQGKILNSKEVSVPFDNIEMAQVLISFK